MKGYTTPKININVFATEVIAVSGTQNDYIEWQNNHSNAATASINFDTMSEITFNMAE